MARFFLMMIDNRHHESRQPKPYILIILFGFFILSLPLFRFESKENSVLTEEYKEDLASTSKQRPFILFQAIPINSANHQQLMSVPGIGPALSKRIIDYRTQHGAFGSFDELLQVNGVGPQKLEKLKEYCRL